jgi:hypothetical protein
MKKSIIMTAGALAVFAAGTLFADDTPVKKSTKVETSKKKVATKSSGGPVDRTLEVRVGPRVSWLTGDVRVGRTGTEFNVEDDLQLDDPNAGIQFNFDYQPFNRIHLEGGLSYDIYNQKGTTTKDISQGENVLLSGASVSTDTDVVVFDVKLGYDVIKNNTLRVKPYIGALGGYTHGFGSISGNTLSGGGTTPSSTRVFKDSFEESYVTFIGGLDTRLYVSRSWYVGADAAGFGWDNVGVIHGQAYTGYDFSKAWGVRAGYAADYITYENSNNSQSAEPLLGAVYVQVVAGF